MLRVQRGGASGVMHTDKARIMAQRIATWGSVSAQSRLPKEAVFASIAVIEWLGSQGRFRLRHARIVVCQLLHGLVEAHRRVVAQQATGFGRGELVWATGQAE